MGKTDLTSAIVFGVATLQGLFLIINLLINKKIRTTAQLFLLGLIIAVVLLLLQNFVILSGYYTRLPHIIFLFYPVNGLLGPLFFLYVLFLIRPGRRFKWYDLIHFSFFGYMFFQNFQFITSDAQDKINAAEYLYFSDVAFIPAIMPGLIFQKSIPVGYGLASLYILNKKLLLLKQYSSNSNQLHLDKFKWIIVAFVCYAVLAVLLQIYSLMFEVYVGQYEIYQHLLNSIIVLALSVIASNHTELLTFNLPEDAGKQSGSQYRDQEILSSLKELMETRKPFLNPELKLHDLAQMSDFSAKAISNAINKHLNINFFEYINQYRVEEFKKRLESKQFEHYTLLAIGFEVGFNSKASMNRIFKNQTGLTPTQFLKEIQVSKHEIETIAN